MNSSYKRYKLYTLVALIASPVLAIVLTVFNNVFYDFSIGLYKVGAPSFPIPAISALLLIFFASCFFTLKRDEMPLRYPKKSSPLTVFASSLAALTMILTLVMQFFAGANDHLAQLYSTTVEGLSTASLMLKISLVLALAGAVYYLLVAITDKASPLLAVLSTLWIFAVVLRIYYDMTYMITDPQRNFTVFALCAAALFILSEIRYLTGKCTPAFFVFAASVASVFCFASGVSKLAFIFMGKLAFDAESAYTFFEIAIALYTLSRLLRFTEKKAFDEEDTLPAPAIAPRAQAKEEAPDSQETEAADAEAADAEGDDIPDAEGDYIPDAEGDDIPDAEESTDTATEEGEQ